MSHAIPASGRLNPAPHAPVWRAPARLHGPADVLDSPWLSRVFIGCTLAYLTIYALEAPLRYLLYLSGKDNFILLRDGLIIVPLSLLFAVQAAHLRIHPAFLIAGLIFSFHGLVLMGTIGNIAGVAYGIKILINILFGFFTATLLIAPSRKVLTILTLLWGLTLIGVCLDKFVTTFPWTGIKTIVGDLSVDVSKDWQIQDTLSRRVAGFTRSSIAVAAVVPPLSLVLISRIQSLPYRMMIAVLSIAAVALSTQKGSLLAFIPIAALMFFPTLYRLKALRLACIAFMIAAVAVPILTQNIHLDHGTGVFSTQSIHLRIADTWPKAWDWIDHHSMLIFGVGLGGIGGPQRLYALNTFNPADNIFILLFAYFGVFAVVYQLAIVFLVLRRVSGSETTATTAVAVIAFAFGYGTVLSVIEDQAASLFLGAALGALWVESRGQSHPKASAPILSQARAVRAR